jgi:hypothetical protein
MENGLVLNSTTLPPRNSIAANSCLSPERTKTLGTVPRTVRSASRSSRYAAHESICASWVQSEVNGTDEIINLKVVVVLTCTLRCKKGRRRTGKNKTYLVEPFVKRGELLVAQHGLCPVLGDIVPTAM